MLTLSMIASLLIRFPMMRHATEHFFDYDLPAGLIAQLPVEPRDAARLLVVRRDEGTLEHSFVRDLPRLLSPADIVVFNDTRVIPARLTGTRDDTGGKWEALVLADRDGLWECMAQTRGFAKIGERFHTHTGLALELVNRTDDRHWLVRPLAEGRLEDLLGRFGQIPLPPYIRKGIANRADVERYQTVYATTPGSVAAPTAGLHFTDELLANLAGQGVATARVTLHVGLGTFAPIKTADPTRHPIHREWCEVSAATVAAITAAKARGGRVVAVGTTTVRTLESASMIGALSEFRGETGLFIHPPYTFHTVNAMLTNFHLPRTTLLLMVQALSGSTLLKTAYETAIREEYRFYSYGDAMLIL
jgi:S-adenosylmethionine:tRNA ribosyltransferase-isomerase